MKFVMKVGLFRDVGFVTSYTHAHETETNKTQAYRITHRTIIGLFDFLGI